MSEDRPLSFEEMKIEEIRGLRPDQNSKNQQFTSSEVVAEERVLEDTRMPTEVLKAMFNEQGQVKTPSERRDAVARVISDNEVDALQVGDEIIQQIQPIMESIAAESHDQYTQSQTDDERRQAVDNASVLGIRRANELVAATLGHEVNASKLVGKASFQTLLKMIQPNLDQDVTGVNVDQVKQIVVEEAKKAWLSKEEERVVADILANDQTMSDAEAEALLIASTGVHISWEGIQDLRTTTDTDQVGDWDKLVMDRSQGVPDSELMNKYGKLRIFRNVFRTFPAMQRSTFADGMKGEEGSLEKGVAKAMLEILKDLVKLGQPLPESS